MSMPCLESIREREVQAMVDAMLTAVRFGAWSYLARLNDVDQADLNGEAGRRLLAAMRDGGF